MASSSKVGNMSQRLTVDEYFAGPETLRPMELVYGVVREPPAPRYGHQSIVTGLAAQLVAHARAHGLGTVCVSPVDVVLDEHAALVVQPDVLFVSRDRMAIVRDRIWGAPDLVVEVLSPATKRRDRTTKLGWYRRYGVRECWLVDPATGVSEVVGPTVGPERRARFQRDEPIVSMVLPAWTVSFDQLQY
jgi:Uma2 family endonuclease